MIDNKERLYTRILGLKLITAIKNRSLDFLINKQIRCCPPTEKHSSNVKAWSSLTHLREVIVTRKATFQERS